MQEVRRNVITRLREERLQVGVDALAAAAREAALPEHGAYRCGDPPPPSRASPPTSPPPAAAAQGDDGEAHGAAARVGDVSGRAEAA